MRLVEVTSETRELTLEEACMVQYIDSFNEHGLCNITIYELASKYLEDRGLIYESVCWDKTRVTGEFVYKDARDMTDEEQYMWDFIQYQYLLRKYFGCVCKYEEFGYVNYQKRVKEYEAYFEKYEIEDD